MPQIPKFKVSVSAYDAKITTLIFVEVKTLADTNVILPEEHVDEEKREHLIKAAEAYLKIKNLDQQVRFDIISVTGSEPPYEIRHIENAFEVPPTFVGR